MDLSEFIKVNRKSTKRYYIGSGTGFFYIGFIGGITKKINAISNEYIKHYETQIAKLEKYLETKDERLKIIDEQIERKYKKSRTLKMRRHRAFYKANASAEKTLNSLKKILNQYTPLLTREIRDVYRKDKVLDENGVVVIVKGKENGKYWNVEEWEKENGRENK